jgi:hypothetical protein
VYPPSGVHDQDFAALCLHRGRGIITDRPDSETTSDRGAVGSLTTEQCAKQASSAHPPVRVGMEHSSGDSPSGLGRTVTIT